MDIGKTVRAIRLSKGLTAMEVAQRMCMHQSAYIRLEIGKRGWRSVSINRAARALAVRPFVLLMSARERRRSKLIFG